MTKFLKDLEKEIDGTPIVNPDVSGDEVLDEEQVVGEIKDEKIKKIYSLHTNLVKKAAKMELDHEARHFSNMMTNLDMSEECKKFHKDLDVIKMKTGLLADLFWASVRYELDGKEYYDLSLKSNWKVVSFKNNKKSSMSIGISGPFGPLSLADLLSI
ncbi:hypothetical protein M1506_03390 [Patescibacteria group bacterium]|nr:hypothetical protein [Patescibacteria group bacterium]